MGKFWELIQTELDRDRFAVSDRKVAERLDVSPTTIANWRKGLRRLPDVRNLQAVANFTGRAYEDVLLTALSETGHAKGTRLETHTTRPPEPRLVITESDPTVSRDTRSETPDPRQR